MSELDDLSKLPAMSAFGKADKTHRYLGRILKVVGLRIAARLWRLSFGPLPQAATSSHS